MSWWSHIKSYCLSKLFSKNDYKLEKQRHQKNKKRETIFSEDEKKKMNSEDEHEEYCFLEACERGDLNLVRSLVRSCPTLVCIHNDEPLQRAVYHGHFELVKYLIEKGANVEASDHKALYLAVNHEHLDIVLLLLYHGAKFYVPCSLSRDYCYNLLIIKFCMSSQCPLVDEKRAKIVLLFINLHQESAESVVEKITFSTSPNLILLDLVLCTYLSSPALSLDYLNTCLAFEIYYLGRISLVLCILYHVRRSTQNQEFDFLYENKKILPAQTSSPIRKIIDNEQWRLIRFLIQENVLQFDHAKFEKADKHMICQSFLQKHESDVARIVSAMSSLLQKSKFNNKHKRIFIDKCLPLFVWKGIVGRSIAWKRQFHHSHRQQHPASQQKRINVNDL